MHGKEDILKKDFKMDTDIMSNVMNRQVGNGCNICHSSLLKHQQSKLVSNGEVRSCDIHSLSNNIQRSISSKAGYSVSNFNDDNELMEFDEVDGFLKDKLKSNQDKGEEINPKNIHVMQEKKTLKGKILNVEKRSEIDTDKLSVEIDDSREGKDNNVDKNELFKRDDNDIFEPRVEIFNELDSNSGSNPFVISSFKSLNAVEAKFMGFDIETFENDESVVKDVKTGEATDSSENQTFSEVKNQSQDSSSIQVGESEYEKDSADSSRHGDEILAQKFASKRSVTKMSFELDVTSENLGKHMNEKIKQNNDTKNACYKRDDKREEKLFVVKKSRKQNVPKRVKKVETFTGSECIDDINIEGYNDIAENIDDDIFKQNEIAESFQMDIDNIKVNGNPEQSDNYVETGLGKSEKSRKQCKPKRIDLSMNINNNVENHDFDDVKFQSETLWVKSESGEKSEKNDSKCFEFNNEINNVLSNVKEIDRTCTEAVRKNGKHDERHDEHVIDPEEFDCNINETDISENLKCLQDSTVKGGSIDHFASMSSNPFYYGFSPDLKVISSLSPGLLQGGCTSSQSGFALDENGPENLEVIRQLREIRCNRYRKISIAEKREISAYANTHGVSQAAAYYNVSKSAVSMWTKLDFSNADEENAVKRKNCMTGNEKFEALCRKVKNERESKFKGMSKEDKFEVSRYAKLVGVREMSRCLGVALGTVSGWMRQFPYKVESDTSDEIEQKKEISTKEDIHSNKTTSEGVQSETIGKKRNKSEPNSKIKKKQKSSVEMDTGYGADKLDQDVVTKNKHHVENEDQVDKVECKGNNDEFEEEEISEEVTSEQSDEVDKMIAETWQKPDIDKCFDEVKELIKDSPLEDDDFFRSLFGRVLACRAEKYKTLKPSEKLEVVRYAKRIGVRRVAKILGLATGTLSGWNTKYQSSLNITDPSLEMSNKTELLVSYLSPDRKIENENIPVTPASLMDNIGEKSEVTAVKLLFKDRFPTLLEKIEVAKQVKFRNITTEEKIEFVKCSKLVGIRPTARVFGIPIGTLSGWISKYSKLLHPAYHVDVDQDTGTNSSDSSSQISQTGMNYLNTVGRNASLPGGLGTSKSFQQESQGMELDLYSQQIQGMQSTQTSLFPSFGLPSSPSLTAETGYRENSDNIPNGDKRFGTSLKNIFKEGLSGNLLHGAGSNFINEEIVNQSSLNLAIRTEQKNNVKQSTAVTDKTFEEEAKCMAEQYLTTAYKNMGIPM